MSTEIVLPLLFTVGLGWLVAHLWKRGEREERRADPPQEFPGERPEGWIQRVPRLFTQPHMGTSVTSGGESRVSRSADENPDGRVRASSLFDTDAHDGATTDGRDVATDRADEVGHDDACDDEVDARRSAPSPSTARADAPTPDGTTARGSDTARGSGSVRKDEGEGSTGSTAMGKAHGSVADTDENGARDHGEAADDMRRTRAGSGADDDDMASRGQADKSTTPTAARGRSRTSSSDAPRKESRDGDSPRARAASTTRDNLTRIEGIGASTAKTLNRHGITTYAQIAAFGSADIERLSDDLDNLAERVERDDWIGQARRLASERSGESDTTDGNAQRTGGAVDGETDRTRAAPCGPDDLKRIKGIGTVLEGRLNALGITRFEQLAAFGPDDIERVSEQMNFKGRIEREDWIAQAKRLAADKRGGG